MRKLHPLVLLLAAFPLWCNAQQPAGNPFDNPAGRAQGAALFQTNCAVCHGARGEGGRGADLTTGSYKHGGSDSQLFANIRNGIPGTEMPAVRATDAEAWQMAAFVKSLASAGLGEKAAGNPTNGKAIFQGKGQCKSCHSVGGDGGTVGPELAGIGRRRGLPYLMESLVSPEADIPTAYRAIQVTTKSGQALRGVRLNEDDVSIQLRDSAGNLRSFYKDALKDIRRDKPALMPSYSTTLTKQELEDLVAYLSSLKGDL